MRAALVRSGRPPIDFLIERFDDDHVVMVGEVHGLQEHAGYVAEAIGPLYVAFGASARTSPPARPGR